MSNPLLVVVSGPPGAGKTTIGKMIAHEVSLPFISKDDIKELLFDQLGWYDREWSKKLGVSSIVLLFEFIEKLLAVCVSVVAESNFQPDFDIARFDELSRKYSFDILQIHCLADNDALVSRFFERADTTQRHRGHVETLNRDEFTQYLGKGIWKPLSIGGQVIRVDTTDWNKVKLDEIFDAVRSLLE